MNPRPETVEPPWLAAFQRDFSSMLRQPLSTRHGRLVPAVNGYSRALAARATSGAGYDGAERLGVYNRQYWLRLFELLQEAYPLLTRLLGPWALNQVAQDYLLVHPPHGTDIDRVADALPAFARSRLDALSLHLPRGSALSTELLLEAIDLDAEFRRVFRAPEAQAFEPERDAPGGLATVRLSLCAACAVVEQRWPLVQLRQALPPLTERPLVAPTELAEVEHWAIVRARRGFALLPLAALEAKLLRLLDQMPLGSALGQLETELDGRGRSELLDNVTGWLARGVRFGFWSAPAPLP